MESLKIWCKSSHVVISCFLRKILSFLSTRELNSCGDGLAHKHRQKPFAKAVPVGKQQHSSGEQPHDVKNSKERALHQARTMKAHENVACS